MSTVYIPHLFPTSVNCIFCWVILFEFGLIAALAAKTETLLLRSLCIAVGNKNHKFWSSTAPIGSSVPDSK